MKKGSYGLELYSLRDITEDSMRLALKKSAEMGYRTVEFAGFYDYRAEQIKCWLDAFGLKAVATHTGLGAVTGDALGETVAYHRAIGCDRIVVPGADWGSEEKMKANLNALNEAQRRLAAEGIRLGYHNHSHEFLPTAYGKILIDEILAETEVSLEVDTFWTFNAGIDTIPWLTRHEDRIFLLHLKDGIPCSEENRTCGACFTGVEGKALGEGKAPVREVIDWAEARGVPMIVESEGLNPTGLEEVGRSIAFLKRIGATA